MITKSVSSELRKTESTGKRNRIKANDLRTQNGLKTSSKKAKIFRVQKMFCKDKKHKRMRQGRTEEGVEAGLTAGHIKQHRTLKRKIRKVDHRDVNWMFSPLTTGQNNYTHIDRHVRSHIFLHGYFRQ